MLTFKRTAYCRSAVLVLLGLTSLCIQTACSSGAIYVSAGSGASAADGGDLGETEADFFDGLIDYSSTITITDPNQQLELDFISGSLTTNGSGFLLTLTGLAGAVHVNVTPQVVAYEVSSDYELVSRVVADVAADGSFQLQIPVAEGEYIGFAGLAVPVVESQSALALSNESNDHTTLITGAAPLAYTDGAKVGFTLSNSTKIVQAQPAIDADEYAFLTLANDNGSYSLLRSAQNKSQIQILSTTMESQPLIVKPILGPLDASGKVIGGRRVLIGFSTGEFYLYDYTNADDVTRSKVYTLNDETFADSAVRETPMVLVDPEGLGFILIYNRTDDAALTYHSFDGLVDEDLSDHFENDQVAFLSIHGDMAANGALYGVASQVGGGGMARVRFDKSDFRNIVTSRLISVQDLGAAFPAGFDMASDEVSHIAVATNAHNMVMRTQNKVSKAGAMGRISMNTYTQIVADTSVSKYTNPKISPDGKITLACMLNKATGNGQLVYKFSNSNAAFASLTDNADYSFCTENANSYMIGTGNKAFFYIDHKGAGILQHAFYDLDKLGTPPTVVPELYFNATNCGPQNGLDDSSSPYDYRTTFSYDDLLNSVNLGYMTTDELACLVKTATERGDAGCFSYYSLEGDPGHCTPSGAVAAGFVFENANEGMGPSIASTGIVINAVSVATTDTNNAVAEHITGPFQSIRVNFSGAVDPSSISCSDFVLEEWAPGHVPGFSNNVSVICTAIDTSHANLGYIDIGLAAPWDTPGAPFVGYRLGGVGQIYDATNELVQLSSYYFYVD